MELTVVEEGAFGWWKGHPTGASCPVSMTRLAVVCPPGRVRFSSRFGEMVAEERRGRYFGLFETRSVAWEWLA